MKQITQNFRSGNLEIADVPVPSVAEGFVLVENRYSLISTGTEKATVEVGKASLLNKARKRPDLVSQVTENIKREGLKSTLAKVQSRLDTPKALGYSTSGIVHASKDTRNHFKIGDRVACAGQDYASHAEVVSVPQHLVVKVPDGVGDDEAAFTTIGAIALQGIRQADPKLGDYVCVIGLGLLGQLTCRLLRASGCMVYGIDLDKWLVDFAEKTSADVASLRENPDLIKDTLHFTETSGFDSVIITASTASNDPVVLASELARKKGRVVIVGDVGMDIPRDPHFYRKELDLRMSTSYGPGRYDPAYEERGHDYPLPYVRWTEERNMKAFLSIAAKGSLDLASLITDRFKIDDAKRAYDIVTNGEDSNHLGILITYEDRPEKFSEVVTVRDSGGERDLQVAFVGAGNFAQSHLIPNIDVARASLHSVVTSKGVTAESVAKKFGFAKAVSDPASIFDSPDVNVVFIATRHDTHAELASQALRAGKHVFVEKPIALNSEQLRTVVEAYKDSGQLLVVGFNRRFSEAASLVVDFFKDLSEPKSMNFRVNAGHIPSEHWTQQEEIGGGRIVGEVCHFVDLMQFITNSDPVSVYAESIPGSGPHQKNDDNVAITIRFNDGSVGVISYISSGGKSLPKERLEVAAGGKTAVIDDFRKVHFYSETGSKTKSTSGKGHKQEVDEFLDAVCGRSKLSLDFTSIVTTTQVTFAIKESLGTGRAVILAE